MLVLEQIIEQIKDAGYAYYRLRGRSDVYASSSMNIGDNLAEKDVSVEQVIQRVKKHVGMFAKANPNFVFELELFKTPQSNQSGKLGVFQFVKEKAEEQLEKSLPDQNKKVYEPTIMGLGAIQEQTQALMQMNNQMLEPRLQLERERTLLEVEKVNLIRDREQFEKEKKELLEKLKKDEQLFNSHTERAKKGAEKAIWGIIDTFVEKEDKGLSGTKTEVEETTELTEEQKLIESIAQNMNEYYENGVLDKAKITLIGGKVQAYINQFKKDEQ